jgi:hypothetical protein
VDLLVFMGKMWALDVFRGFFWGGKEFIRGGRVGWQWDGVGFLGKCWEMALARVLALVFMLFLCFFILIYFCSLTALLNLNQNLNFIIS